MRAASTIVRGQLTASVATIPCAGFSVQRGYPSGAEMKENAIWACIEQPLRLHVRTPLMAGSACSDEVGGRADLERVTTRSTGKERKVSELRAVHDEIIENRLDLRLLPLFSCVWRPRALHVSPTVQSWR